MALSFYDIDKDYVKYYKKKRRMSEDLPGFVAF